MENPQIKNYKSLSNKTKTVLIMVCCVFGLTTIFFSVQYFNALYNSDYITLTINDKGSYKAMQESHAGGERSMYDAEQHAKLYMSKMWSHDAFTYDDNTEFALNLINKKDGSLHLMYLEEKSRKQSYIQNDYRVDIQFNNMTFINKVEPFIIELDGQYNAVFKDKIQNQAQQFKVQMELIAVPESPVNPHGLFITNFQFKEIPVEDE